MSLEKLIEQAMFIPKFPCSPDEEKKGILGLYDSIKSVNNDEVANSFAKWLLQDSQENKSMKNVDYVFSKLRQVKRETPKSYKYRDYRTIKISSTVETHEESIRNWCKNEHKNINLTEDICSKCSKGKENNRNNDGDSNQVEKHYCCRSYVKYDKVVVGYEVPLAHTQKDGQNRNVDILFVHNNSLYLGEAKEPNSKECLLRAVLEIETYYNRIKDKDYFISNFRDLLPNDVDESNLKKSILVWKEWFETQNKNQPEVIKLMKHLNIEAFNLEELEKDGKISPLPIN